MTQTNGIITEEDALNAIESPTDYATEFVRMLDAYHSQPEKFDDELDAEIFRMFYEVTRAKTRPKFGKLPYFSPSSANSCPRELYMKVRKERRDQRYMQPHQGRWVRHGTAIGDSLQRDLLFIEKHYADIVGEKPSFVFERTEDGYPAFEDFKKALVKVEAPDDNGELQAFNLFGKPDGIMKHVATGNTLGLEIKSKQTTAAQTGHFKMKEPKEDHVKQCVAYSVMYGVDDFIITYINGSKKNWVLTEEEYAKNPDIRAFHVRITEEDRQELLSFFAEIVRRAKEGDPPKLALDKWNFNGYKTACALDLSREELDEIEMQVERIKKSKLPDFIKRNATDALADIKEIIREERG